jgi:hypothetical protein
VPVGVAITVVSREGYVSVYDRLPLAGYRYTENGQDREATNEAWTYSADKKQWTEVKYTGQQVPQANPLRGPSSCTALVTATLALPQALTRDSQIP